MSISNSKKVHAKQSHSARANGSAHHAAVEVAALLPDTARAGVAAAPKVGAPRTPKGFVAPAKKGRKLTLQRGQLACAAMVAAELAAASSPEADFGPHAPVLAPIGAVMALAAKWSSERVRADAWRAYARAQEIDAWAPALAELDALRPAFVYAMSRDPAIGDRYPSLALFFGLRTQSGVKAGRTRRAKKAVNGKAQPKPVAVAQGTEVPANGHGATLQ